jgi:hypothetical protein
MHFTFLTYLRSSPDPYRETRDFFQEMAEICECEDRLLAMNVNEKATEVPREGGRGSHGGVVYLG